jgi:hypothetical protein
VFTVAPDANQIVIDPGPIGFIAIAVVAIGAVLLILDMVRRIRRTRIRAEVAAMLDAEVAAASKDAETK